MCIFPKPPKPKDPVMPPEYAQQRAPDADATRGAGSKMADRIRSGAGTILTSGSGVTQGASTEKKTLLGA